MARDVPHTTLYRTYRPADFDEVRGQEHVVGVLEKAIKNKKVAHAYLFCGGRGTGKTSVARILAKRLGVTGKDLYEIDAASQNSVDDIRSLREAVNSMPFESPYRFYIIDEAHMLSKAAWNAFLKTLEEPPGHVIFVMATTERDKVPDTIQSRCEIYTFKQPSREVLAQIAQDVAKKEGYALERPAADLVALLAEGSFRDALSILQKVLVVSKDKNVDIEEVEAVSGAPRGEVVRQIVTSLARRDADGAIQAIGALVAQNMDARVLANAPSLADELGKELGEADRALAKELSKEPYMNSDVLRALLEAHARMAYAAVPHLPLELAVIETCPRGTV
jgi:DNA polymerase III subunit gamma/tau